jgi:hypothetical protein
MNLNYQITTGQLTDDDGNLVATGFSGNNSRPLVNPNQIQGMNNPDEVSVHKIGPLPPGTYDVGTWGTHTDLGPISATLTQTSGETYGRGEFYIHGPSTDPNQYWNSSEGCICIPHDERLKVMNLNPDQITVEI